MRLTASRELSTKEREEMLQFMRTEQVGEVVVTVQREGEADKQSVLKLEKQDADGRTLLAD